MDVSIAQPSTLTYPQTTQPTIPSLSTARTQSTATTLRERSSILPFCDAARRLGYRSPCYKEDTDTAHLHCCSLEECGANSKTGRGGAVIYMDRFDMHRHLIRSHGEAVLNVNTGEYPSPVRERFGIPTRGGRTTKDTTLTADQLISIEVAEHCLGPAVHISDLKELSDGTPRDRVHPSAQSKLCPLSGMH